MGEVKLSILIPITPERYKTVQPLLNIILGGDSFHILDIYGSSSKPVCLKVKMTNRSDVNLITISDNKEMTLGEKRERLYALADGKYSWQIDSDDLIAPNAIELILKAIDENPDVDCITFEEKVLINGEEYRSNFSNKYADWVGDGNSEFFDGFHFQRTVFYKCVIKTELAKQVPFKPLRFGEDHEWAKDLKPLIQTEYHIPEQLYHYIHNSKPQDFNERYGFDKQ